MSSDRVREAMALCLSRAYPELHMCQASTGYGRTHNYERSPVAVDESEERTRWVPWVLLAAVIVAAVVAAVVIIRFAVNSDDGTQSSASKVVNLDNGKYSRYQECAPIMARLRQTSQENDFSPEVSHQTRLNKGASSNQDTPEVLQYTSTSDGQVST